MRILRIFPLAGTAGLVLSAAAYGIINPNFTPLHLVEQSDLILQLAVRAAKEPNLLRATVARPLKGKAAADAFTIDLDLLEKGHAEEVRAAFAGAPNRPGMFFSGQCGEEGAERKPKIFFHTNGKWLELTAAGEGRYRASPEDPNLEPTWAGGTDMLIRAIEYALSDPQPAFPVRSGIAWDERQDLGKIEARVHSARPVDLDGGRRPAPGDRRPAPGRGLARYLHLGAEAGDRLYQWDADAEAFKDVTAGRGLSAKSAVSAWGDFNADGRLDLASWDGKSLGLHLQAEDGKLAARPVRVGAALKDGCLGLAVIDCGKAPRAGEAGTRPALLASTPGWPVLLVPEADGSYAAKPLGEGALPGQDRGQASPCLAADLDGDRVADVLQLFEKGALFYRGKGRGAFEPARELAIRSGGGGAPPFTGDFDADGLLDVFVTGTDRCRLWHNRGELRFEERLGLSGETAYNCETGGIGGATGDFNADGRQDLLVLYADMAPQLFFNRGFRSFGHAPNLAPSAQKMGMDVRQQAGCLGDFNGDGTQDLALVLREGEVCVLPGRQEEDETPLSIAVSLALGGGYAGPLTVTGFREGRCLGAWSVTAGGADAVIALREPDAVELRWQVPGRKMQKKTIVLEDRPVQFVIRAAAPAGGGP